MGISLEDAFAAADAKDDQERVLSLVASGFTFVVTRDGLPVMGTINPGTHTNNYETKGKPIVCKGEFHYAGKKQLQKVGEWNPLFPSTRFALWQCGPSSDTVLFAHGWNRVSIDRSTVSSNLWQKTTVYSFTVSFDLPRGKEMSLGIILDPTKSAFVGSSIGERPPGKVTGPLYQLNAQFTIDRIK